MRRSGGGLLCALAVLLLTGCAHTSGLTDFFQGTLSFLHIGKSPDIEKASAIEKSPAVDHQAGVCMLDPVAYTAELHDQPAPASDKAPTAEISETTHDFGKFKEDGELVHKFNVRNTGKSVLNIKKVLPG